VCDRPSPLKCRSSQRPANGIVAVAAVAAVSAAASFLRQPLADGGDLLPDDPHVGLLGLLGVNDGSVGDDGVKSHEPILLHRGIPTTPITHFRERSDPYTDPMARNDPVESDSIRIAYRATVDTPPAPT
jgi:hypothetical protein